MSRQISLNLDEVWNDFLPNLEKIMNLNLNFSGKKIRNLNRLLIDIDPLNDYPGNEILFLNIIEYIDQFVDELSSSLESDEDIIESWNNYNKSINIIFKLLLCPTRNLLESLYKHHKPRLIELSITMRDHPFYDELRAINFEFLLLQLWKNHFPDME